MDKIKFIPGHFQGDRVFLNNLLFLSLAEARVTILGNLLCVGFEVVPKKTFHKIC